MGILIIVPKFTISQLNLAALEKMFGPDCVVAIEPRDMVSVSNDEIIAIVANFFNIPKADILGEKREVPIVHARHVAMYLLHESGSSYSVIGRMMNRDHSTVCSAIAGINRSLDSLFSGKVAEDELCGIRSDMMLYIKNDEEISKTRVEV